MLKYDLIMVRYGELGLKSPRVRKRFEHKLISNIKSAFPGEIKLDQGRIFIKPDDFDEALEYLKKIFGIVSFSPVISMETDKNIIKTELEHYVDELTSRGIISSKTSFAIRCRRIGEHPFTSQELAGFAGAVVVDKIRSPVDLTNPELEIFLEVRYDETFIYHQKLQGPGGLPLGTQGKLVALLSGGIDSPVAAYLMMKRGCQIIALNFNNYPFTESVTQEKVIKMVKKLREYSSGVKLDLKIIEYGEYLKKCQEKAPEKLTCILCKSGMYSIAEMIANREGALGIVDGNSLGQVASQTLQNLLVTRQSVKLPIFSPLIGLDKIDIEKLAQEIGTYDISIEEDGGCSAVPRYPETQASLDRVLEAQKSLNIDKEIKETFKTLKNF